MVTFYDCDFIVNSNFLKDLHGICRKINFKKYSLGIPVWETHDTFNINGKIRRYCHQLYGALYIYHVNLLKYVGGFNFNIDGHGQEERELSFRLYNNKVKTFYTHSLFPNIYAIHFSHDDNSRGDLRHPDEIKKILNVGKLKKIKFNFQLPVLKKN